MVVQMESKNTPHEYMAQNDSCRLSFPSRFNIYVKDSTDSNVKTIKPHDHTPTLFFQFPKPKPTPQRSPPT